MTSSFFPVLRFICPIFLIAASPYSQSTEMLTDAANGCLVARAPGAKDSDSVTWTGACVRGRAEGAGRVTWLRGHAVTEEFEGTYSAGVPHGKGRYRDENGWVYDGGWVSGQRSGNGTLTMPNMEYVGEWANNQFDGNGRLNVNDGFIEGIFSEGKITGDAKVKFQDGRQYVGSLNNWKLMRGTLTSPDGSVYTGTFLNNEFDGEGVFVLAKDVTYKGFFARGKFNGHGVLSAPAATLEGDFLDGAPAGLATIRWPSGDTLTTAFRDNKPHGDATLTQASGAVETFSFANGVPTRTSTSSSDSDAADVLISLLGAFMQHKADSNNARRASNALSAQQAAETAARRNAQVAEQQRQANLAAQQANLVVQERARREQQQRAQSSQAATTDAARIAETDRQVQQRLAQVDREISARQAQLKYASEQTAMQTAQRQRAEQDNQRREAADRLKQEQQRLVVDQQKKSADDAQFRGYSAVGGRTNHNAFQVTTGILVETSTTPENTISGMPCADGVQVFNESGRSASVTINVRWLQKYNCQPGGFCSFRNAYESFVIRLRSPDARMKQFPMEMQEDIRVRSPGGLTCNITTIVRASVKFLD